MQPDPAERLSFIHLSGPRQGEVDVLDRLPSAIGSEPDADMCIPGIAPRHAVVLRVDGNVVLLDSGSAQGTYLAGESVRRAVLRDGDVVELGSGGPRLRFRHEGAAVHTHLLDAQARPRAEGWPAAGKPGFFKAFLRDATAHTSHAFRVTLAGLLVISLGGLLWSQWEAYRLQSEVARLRDAISSAERERHAFEARIAAERKKADAERQALDTLRTQEDELSRKLAEATSGEVLSLRDQLTFARDRLETLESERAAGERIIREYGGGVCLIQGSYAFYDASARPLRYKLDDDGEAVRDKDGSPVFDVEGGGPIHKVDYFGTGFLADRRGMILTNRHVAEPWYNDDAAQALIKTGMTPRFLLFRAFFPSETEPFELDPDRHSDKVDVALLRIETRGRQRLPVLPLERSGYGAVAGQPVVVVGYPTGLEAILAKADSGVVQQILEAHGTSSERVTEALARKGLIRPSTTQGHIGDITRTDIVFDAPTTQGGSGGPVFNKNGRVIAVEYAVLSKFGGNSFGVPMRYALELLASPKR